MADHCFISYSTVDAFEFANKFFYGIESSEIKSMLRLFDELVKSDEEGMLKDVREVIEGN